MLKNDVEKLAKTRDVVELLEKLNLELEYKRVKESKKIRAGRGKTRGRRYKIAKGPLFVISADDVPLIRAARNIPGVDIVTPNKLTAALLAPGTHAGRLTIFSEKALKALDQIYM